jgi:hypothetical protein
MPFDELLAEQEVLGGDDGTRGEESQEGCDYVANKVDHRAILGPVVSQVQPRRARAPFAACASSFCGAQVYKIAIRKTACVKHEPAPPTPHPAALG